MRGMRRAGTQALATIPELLAQLRAHPALRERRAGVFCTGPREFLHFHDDPAGGLVADVRFHDEIVRMPVDSPSQQADLLARIDDCLEALDARAEGRRRGRERRGWKRGERERDLA